MIDRMQARTELYEMIGLHAYEALDASIIGTIVAETILQTFWRLYKDIKISYKSVMRQLEGWAEAHHRGSSHTLMV